MSSCDSNYSWDFPRQENWSGLPFPSPGESSWPGDQTCVSHLAGIFFITESPGKPKVCPRCSTVIENRLAPYHRGWHSSWQLMVFLDYSTTFINLLLARPILDLMQNPASIHWHQIKFWRQSIGWSRKEWASLLAQESTCQCRRHGCDPWAGKIPWRRAWQPISIFSLGESHGQRSLAGYSPGSQRVRHDWSNLVRMHLLLYNKVTQLYTHTHTYIYNLFHILFNYGLSQDTELSFPCYPVGPCCLFTLHTRVCTC